MFKALIITLAVLLVIGLAGFFVFHNYYYSMLEPVDASALDDYRIVEIPSGASTEIIANILENENLIRDELVFRLFVRRHNLGQSFMAGRYSLSPSMSLEQIVQKIQIGDTYSETVWVTIPEGFTVEKIAIRLDELGLVDGDNFLELGRKAPEDIIEAFPMIGGSSDPDIEYQLEGYLFPDTYEVFPDAGEDFIIKMMLHRMEEILNELDYKDIIGKKGLSLHELLIIASLIEREARVDHERAKVASVIYNRLEIGQRLQIDATIQYILEEPKEFLLYKDLEIPSPYNTYLVDGLPPGPIASPGRASIDAALNPERTDYFYYNYKYDGSGEHYFSRTLQEHYENVSRAEANLQ